MIAPSPAPRLGHPRSLERAVLGAVLAASCLAAPASARAQQPGPRASDLSDAEVTRRLALLQGHLDRGTPAANRWWYGWYGAYAALTIGQAAIALAVDDPGTRADMAVGAVTSSLGVLPLGLFPFEPRHAAADLRGAPERTAAERRAKLARGERLLAASADIESFGQSWVAHALGAGVSVASGLVLALAYDRVASGVVNGVGGIALGELQILTQPTAAIDDWKSYQRATGRPVPDAKLEPVRWQLAPYPGGIALVGRL